MTPIELNMIITMAERAGEWIASGYITVPSGSSGEDILADYCVQCVNEYRGLPSRKTPSFDEFIEKKLLEKFRDEDGIYKPRTYSYNKNYFRDMSIVRSEKFKRDMFRPRVGYLQYEMFLTWVTTRMSYKDVAELFHFSEVYTTNILTKARKLYTEFKKEKEGTADE